MLVEDSSRTPHSRNPWLPRGPCRVRRTGRCPSVWLACAKRPLRRWLPPGGRPCTPIRSRPGKDPLPGPDSGRIRVEAAAIGPQVTYFHVAEPGEMAGVRHGEHVDQDRHALWAVPVSSGRRRGSGMAQLALGPIRSTRRLAAGSLHALRAGTAMDGAEPPPRGSSRSRPG